MSSTLTRKNYWSLDIAKFFCAILIISSHFATEWGNFPTLIDYAFSLYVIAVPFFFCCSGFLFFKKLNSLETKEDKKKYFIQYEKRIWIMYGLWSAVYFIHVVYMWIEKDELSVLGVLKHLFKSIVHTSYGTIWFLPALAIGVAIAYFLTERLNKKAIFSIATALYIFGMFGYTYRFFIEGSIIESVYDVYEMVLFTSRNGIFNGAPFILMGYFISLKEIKYSLKRLMKYVILAVVSLGLVVIEAFILKLKFNVTGMDTGIFLVPFTYFFVMSVIHLDIKENKLWLWCRKLSLLMFVSQRLFLTMLPAFFPNIFNAIYSNSYIGLIAVIGITISFSVVFILLSDKIKFLKKMI